jgi:hypothetical protein
MKSSLTRVLTPLFGVLLVVLAAALPATAGAATASPRVVNGSQIDITQAPWQVAIFDNPRSAYCGGSILDATHILTAAHCVAVAEGSGTPVPAGDLQVWAGIGNVATGLQQQPAPAGTQVVGVASFRMHPGYPGLSTKSDDVAVLTLAAPLDLSGPKAKPIGLAAPGAGTPDGTVLRVQGFGKQDPAESSHANGGLYMTNVTAVGDDDCRNDLGVDGAVVQCARGNNSSTCFGDSGGSLVTNDPVPVVVGVVSYGPKGGCNTGNDMYADVTAPEVRAFIDGAASLPLGPRVSAYPGLSATQPPVQGSPLTCQPGAWTNNPTFAYVFKTDTAPSVMLQAGPSPVYVPGKLQLYQPIVCVVVATTPGGVAMARSGTTSPIQLDTIKPRSLIRSATCKKRKCTITTQAADSNSLGALVMRTSVSYTRKVTCRKHGRRTTCTKQRVRVVKMKQLNANTFRGTMTSLPYQRLKISFQVTDAAGNKAPTVTKRVTMRKR